MFIVFPGVFKKTNKRKTRYILRNYLQVLFYKFSLNIKFYTEAKAMMAAQKLYSLLLIRSVGYFYGFLPLDLLVLYGHDFSHFHNQVHCINLKIRIFTDVKNVCVTVFIY